MDMTEADLGSRSAAAELGLGRPGSLLLSLRGDPGSFGLNLFCQCDQMNRGHLLRFQDVPARFMKGFAH